MAFLSWPLVTHMILTKLLLCRLPSHLISLSDMHFPTPARTPFLPRDMKKEACAPGRGHKESTHTRLHVVGRAPAHWPTHPFLPHPWLLTPHTWSLTIKRPHQRSQKCWGWGPAPRKPAWAASWAGSQGCSHLPVTFPPRGAIGDWWAFPCSVKLLQGFCLNIYSLKTMSQAVPTRVCVCSTCTGGQKGFCCLA